MHPCNGNDQITDVLQSPEENATHFEIERTAANVDHETITIDDIGTRQSHLLYMQMETNQYHARKTGQTDSTNST